MEAVLKKHSDGRFSLSHKESGVDSVEHGYGIDYYNETFKSE